jgi:hypothetical protein
MDKTGSGRVPWQQLFGFLKIMEYFNRLIGRKLLKERYITMKLGSFPYLVLEKCMRMKGEKYIVPAFYHKDFI